MGNLLEQYFLESSTKPNKYFIQHFITTEKRHKNVIAMRPIAVVGLETSRT